MCKAKIKKMGGFLQFLTGSGVAAITLMPFGIFMKEKYLTNVRMINHEKIHWAQQMEMAVTGAIIALITGIILLSLGIYSWWLLLLLVFPFLFFYLWYVIEWFLKVITPPSGAYEDIGFEREAYTNDDNLNYLNIRKLFAWLKRIFK
jgi:hypothetical protein